MGPIVIVAAVVALVVGLVAGVVGARIGRVSSSTTNSAVVPIPQASGDTSPRAEGTIAAIVAGALPSVVSILIEGPNGSGNGSGFVLLADGYIVTNNHVVESSLNGGTLEVEFFDGSKAEAEIVGRNLSYDIAVVKVDRDALATLTLGDSDAVQVGDSTIAIGAPLGLDGTVTSGIVSALNRPVTAGQADGNESYINAIQTDAAINPGNSGGPLLDGKGFVIGVNSAIATLANGGRAGSIGLGFAIPSNSVKRVAEEIIATGTSTNPIMGVTLDLKYTGEGARIQQVTEGGPAAQAGLQSGDIVTSFDDRLIANSTELVVAIRSNEPGQTVPVTVSRDGSDVTVDLTLGSQKG
jgi:putative serine protease PepD